MTNISRRDPFFDFNTAMDRLFEGGVSRPWRLLSDESISMPIEVSESEDAVHVKASLPGVKPEDIDISVQGDMVSIKAESREDTQEKQRNYVRREFQYGAVQRTIPLPTPVDVERTEASFENGVLRLTLPKSESSRPRRIKVQGTGSSNVIDQSGPGQ